jgi:hypothetical protein
MVKKRLLRILDGPKEMDPRLRMIGVIGRIQNALYPFQHPLDLAVTLMTIPVRLVWTLVVHHHQGTRDSMIERENEKEIAIVGTGSATVDVQIPVFVMIVLESWIPEDSLLISAITSHGTTTYPPVATIPSPV